MPNVAEVSASVPAPTSPASSSSGEKARPVAGPPTSVTDPATTPSSGCSPKAWAIAMPRKFWTKQKAMAKSRKITHLDAADAQQRQARAHADRAEEGDAQHRLRRRVELHAEKAVPADQHQQREEQPADHGRGNVQPVEPADPLAQLEPHEVEDGREAQGLEQIQFQFEHVGVGEGLEVRALIGPDARSAAATRRAAGHA